MTYDHTCLGALVAWESEQQKNEFFFCVSEIQDREFVEKLLSVMNKPSQFVGRVNDYTSAALHWKEWEVYVAQMEAELPKDDIAIEVPRKRGRPSDRNIDRAAVEKASDVWHAAVNGRKKAKLDWADWRRAEIAKIEELYAKNLADWDNYVAFTKDELSRLKSGN